MPRFLKTSAATTPHGTAGSHTATLMPGRARSAGVVIPAGFDGGTAISSVFLTKSVGLNARAPSAFMFFSDAEAKTSTGAPCAIWVERSELAPKVSLTLAPGWSFSNRALSVVNASVSDAAASTVIEPPPWRGPDPDEEQPPIVTA